MLRPSFQCRNSSITQKFRNSEILCSKSEQKPHKFPQSTLVSPAFVPEFVTPISVTCSSIWVRQFFAISQMGRKQIDQEASRLTLPILILVSFISCAAVYTFLPFLFRLNGGDPSKLESFAVIRDGDAGNLEGGAEECCRGIENLEYWGPAVKWGSEFKFNSSELCCKACKAMCNGNDGPCLCDTWVYCGNRTECGSKFGECWLKKQKDTLAPDRQEGGTTSIWTSGLIFGRGEGIVALETDHGTLHIKLFPDCAPHSVAYILELLELRHCAGCHFYRAEGRGQSWDSKGNPIENAPLGPPFALIQGTLETQGEPFKKISPEVCPYIKRGSVAWVGSGPEFFISLANHQEWNKVYTVFGSVLPEDMEVAEKIAGLPTKPDVWNNVNVSVLQEHVPLRLKRMKKSHGD